MLLKFNDFKFLVENVYENVVLSFGRMNPPTIGHQKLMKKIVEVAKINDAIPMLFLSHTQDRKKNPLSYVDKLRFVKSGAPKELQVMNSPAKTLFEVVEKLSSIGYKNFWIVCGSDRVNDFNKLKNYQDLYGYSTLEVVSAGFRDADSEDATSSISASKLREFAKNDDYDSFSKNAGCSKNLVKEMYDLVKNNMK